MGVRIEPFQEHHLPALQAFLQSCYPDSPLKADVDYFRWRFAGDPRGSSLPHYFLALNGDAVIGQWCGLDDRIWVEGTWHDCTWLIDLIVAPEYRRSAALMGVARAVMATGTLCLATGADEHVVPLYEAMRWRRYRMSETFYAPLRPSRLARLAMGTGRVSSRMAWLHPALWVSDLVVPPLRKFTAAKWRGSQDLVVEPLTEFAPEIDVLCENLLPRLGRTSDRSAAILRWKFDRRPVGEHFALALRDRRDRTLRGYLVAKWMHRQSVRWAEVADMVVDPGDRRALGVLLRAAERTALQRRVDFLRLRCGLPEHTQALRRPAWIRKTAPVVDDVFAYSIDRALLDALAAGPWHLTSLVSDRVDYGRDEWGEINGPAPATPATVSTVDRAEAER